MYIHTVHSVNTICLWCCGFHNLISTSKTFPVKHFHLYDKILRFPIKSKHTTKIYVRICTYLHAPNWLFTLDFYAVS